MNIFKKIGDSVYSPEFYKTLKTSTFGSTLKYYVKLALLLSIIPAIVWSFYLIPEAKNYLTTQSVGELVEFYPEELSLSIKDGQFSTNVTEPYFIPIPAEFKKASSTDGKVDAFENIVVIDTSVETFSSDILEQNKTAVFITKNSIIMMDDGGLQVTPMDDYKSFTYDINRQTLAELGTKALAILIPMLYFLPVLILIGYFVSYMSFLISLLAFALIIWLVLIIMKVSLGYKYAYRVTVHAMTLALLLDIVYFIITKTTLNWLVMLVIAIIVVVLNIKREVTVGAVTESAVVVK